MEQQQRVDLNNTTTLHHEHNKKTNRPKSAAFLSWILNNNHTATERNNDEEEEAQAYNVHSRRNTKNNSGSNKLELKERHQCKMMNTSLSAPTATAATTEPSYDTTRNNAASKLILPLPPLHKLDISTTTYCNNNYTTNITTSPSIIVDSQNCSNNNDNSNKDDVEIPNRRQSHLYTPFHDNNNVFDKNNNNYNSKRRSYYVSNLAPIDTSTLSRSATWQPSSSNNANNKECNHLLNDIPGNNHQQQHLALNIDSIPARRTSRNYADNPEIQAKLDAMLNNDKALYLSTIIHNNNTNTDPSSSSSNNIYRRSTTPGSRMN